MCKYLTIGCPGVRGFSASLSDEISSASPNRSFAAGFLPTRTHKQSLIRAAVCMTVCFIVHSFNHLSLTLCIRVRIGVGVRGYFFLFLASEFLFAVTALQRLWNKWPQTKICLNKQVIDTFCLSNNNISEAVWEAVLHFLPQIHWVSFTNNCEDYSYTQENFSWKMSQHMYEFLGLVLLIYVYMWPWTTKPVIRVNLSTFIQLLKAELITFPLMYGLLG